MRRRSACHALHDAYSRSKNAGAFLNCKGRNILWEKNIPKERKEGMYKAILELKSLEECFDFFEDICAMTELRSMEQRFEVASMLKKEKVYTEIMSETNASSATISRVNRMLNYGTGCLGEVIDRLDKKEDKEGTEES